MIEQKLTKNLYSTEEEENPELQALSERLTTMFNDPSVDDEQKLTEGRQAMAYIENISRGIIRPQLFYNSITTSSLAADYCQWDFCFSVLKLPHRQEEWETSKALLKTCGWIFPFKKVCVICDRPTKISLDEKRQLHASGEPAIEFSDGYCVYAYRGALQTEPLNPKLELAEKYQQETNPRLRQAIVESYSVENLDVDWLFMESDFQVREILFQKLGSERIIASLQDSDPFGLLPQALTEDAGSLLWVAFALLQNQEEPRIAKFIRDSSSPTINLKQLRASLMRDSLETIVAWLEQYAPNFVDDFLPGLDEEEISRRLEQLPFKVPREVCELYQWRNGISSERMLFVYHDFLELERAIEQSEMLSKSIPERERDNEPAYLFLLFEFESEYFAVAGGDKVVETAPVYHISDIFEVTLVFNSITTMMLALAESYECGYYRAENLDEFGSVDVDFKQLARIRHKYNPGTVEPMYLEGE
ncbi:DUF6745 domain-containing protein [Myxosarcina sp. GI1]|uniref:DUF6745 domain-containing protein n=1 Tax=Myxosarcina sp. GI1 TaxID=1541065 RepID=UPI0012DFF4C8|nr:SMI1/KNR4 family protein [Myxosarcina sp. GI1]